MGKHDASIRIHAELDNKDVKQGTEEIEESLDKVEEKAQGTKAGIEWDEKGAKEFEESIDRILQKKKELAKQQTEQISTGGPISEDMRPYDAQADAGFSRKANQEIEAYARAVDENAQGAEKAAESYNLLRVDVEEYAKSLKELEEQGLYFGDEDYDRVYIAWENAKDAVKQYANELAQQTEKGKEATAEAERLNQIRQEAVVSNQDLVALMQEQENITKRIAELKKAGVTDGYQEYEDLSARLGEIGTKIAEARDGFGKAKKSAGRLFDSIKKGAKTSSGLLGTLKSMALSLLVFNTIRKAFNAMVSAAKEGFKNLAQYSAEYNRNMSELKSESAQLKNGLAAAFEPVANIIVPYLSMFVSWVNRAAEAMSKLLAVMQGKTTYTRAKKQMVDYAKSLNTASKAAKGALASFDELNVLSKESDTSGGELTGAAAFETVSLTENDMQIVDVLKDKLAEILEILGAIGLAMTILGIGGPFLKLAAVLLIIIGLLKFILEYMDAWANGISFDNLKGMLIGLGAVILGIYILFGPIAAGIAAIVGGIALVVLAIKDMLDNGVNAQNSITLAIGLVTALVGIFIVFGSTVAVIIAAIVAVVAAFAAMIAITGNGKEAIDTLKSVCKNFADFFKKIFAGDIKGAMESLKKACKDLVNVLIIAFESLVNCIVMGLNWLIDKINSISFDVPDWVPIIGGDTLSPNIPHIPEAKLPRLAKGAVIQGGQPFAAILGDQPRGQVNIETPLETMLEAFRQARAEDGGGQYTFIAQLDGKEIFRNTVRQDRLYRKQTGESAFLT